jgi:hypothetical protein
MSPTENTSQLHFKTKHKKLFSKPINIQGCSRRQTLKQHKQKSAHLQIQKENLSRRH